jgi:hypothetical protein
VDEKPRYRKVAQKPMPHVPKFTLKTLSQEKEETLAQNHLILGHDQVSGLPTPKELGSDR